MATQAAVQEQDVATLLGQSRSVGEKANEFFKKVHAKFDDPYEAAHATHEIEKEIEKFIEANPDSDIAGFMSGAFIIRDPRAAALTVLGLVLLSQQ
jgi:hypothetical protein